MDKRYGFKTLVDNFSTKEMRRMEKITSRQSKSNVYNIEKDLSSRTRRMFQDAGILPGDENERLY